MDARRRMAVSVPRSSKAAVLSSGSVISWHASDVRSWRIFDAAPI